MKITNERIYGLEESIVASGYPMQSWVSDKMQGATERDQKRAEKLGNAPQGSGHDNFLKGIIVQMDVTASVKWWTQAQRYHWLDFVSSCSTMHRMQSFDIDRVYNKYVDQAIVERMRELQVIYNADQTKENFLRLIYSNPCGMELTARMTTNYQQLKTMYSQRWPHPLPEWGVLCGWIEGLPNTKELGVCVKCKQKRK